MSEQSNNSVNSKPTNNSKEEALPAATVAKQQRSEGQSRLAEFIGKALEQSDVIVYAIVGVCFVFGALLALGYTFWSFSNSITDIFNYHASASQPTAQATPAPAQTSTTITSTINSPSEAQANDPRPGMFATTIISLVSDLLLVLIIMEVLSTVIEYLKNHVTSLTPFLAIGIISATRGVLSIGARLSVGIVGQDEFNRSMLELGVNALAILALGITLTLLSRSAHAKENA